MARIRTVKPDFFRHVALFDAEVETGLPLRIAFAGLWTCADREGRFRWEPRTLKLDALPHDAVDFARVLNALQTRGFVEQYEVAGEVYGCIPSWTRHQVINNREQASSIPPPPKKPKQKEPITDASITREQRDDDESTPPLSDALQEGERKGRGREGEESSLRSDCAPHGAAPTVQDNSSGKKPRGKHRLPEDFQPNRELALAYWDRHGRRDLSARIGDIENAFRAHYRKLGTKFEDWDAAWIAWFSNEPARTKLGTVAIVAPTAKAAAIEPHPSWNGPQSALVAKVGEAEFSAYFAAAKFDPGPPAVIEVASQMLKSKIESKFRSPLRALFGAIEIAVAKDLNA